MKEQKIFSRKLQFSVLVAILLMLFVSVYVSMSREYTSSQRAEECTKEIKECPDGSFVGRVGARCEFSACPEVKVAGWATKQIASSGITFSYPEKLSLFFMHPTEWPPVIEVASGTPKKDAIVFSDFPEVKVQVGANPQIFFSCEESVNQNPGVPSVHTETIDGRMYCVRTSSEGAAGSVYETSVYEMYTEGKLVTATVVMQKQNCLNYDDPKKSECQKEREAFHLDVIMDRILQSVKIQSVTQDASHTNPDNAVVCTMEAKMCPDGSFVGRSGPNCEFKACPTKLSLKDALAECLPKSDMKSKETCDALIGQIQSYQDCASAGFTIIETYPEQCILPDGREFVNK